MGVLMKNDINYSNSSVKLDTTLSVEGQAADAKAVGDAITNINSTVRYNEETDLLEFLCENEWKSSKLFMGGLERYLYHSSDNYELTWNQEPTNIKFTVQPGAGSGTTKYYTTDAIDVTNFNNILFHNITMTVVGYYGYNGDIIIYGGSTAQGTDLFSKTVVSQKTSYSGSVEVDLSNITGDLYLTIAYTARNGSSTTYVTDLTSSIEYIKVYNN